MLKSYPEVEQCILDYLREHDGTAPAGDVTAHAIAAGFASSTIRRVAASVVVKRREGNVFVWSLHPPATASVPAAVTEPETADSDDAIDSPYARMGQHERLHLIRTRPVLEPWTDEFPPLTEMEAIHLLDMDDAGEIHLPGVNHTATGARAPF